MGFESVSPTGENESSSRVGEPLSAQDLAQVRYSRSVYWVGWMAQCGGPEWATPDQGMGWRLNSGFFMGSYLSCYGNCGSYFLLWPLLLTCGFGDWTINCVKAKNRDLTPWGCHTTASSKHLTLVVCSKMCCEGTWPMLKLGFLLKQYQMEGLCSLSRDWYSTFPKRSTSVMFYQLSWRLYKVPVHQPRLWLVGEAWMRDWLVGSRGISWKTLLGERLGLTWAAGKMDREGDCIE